MECIRLFVLCEGMKWSHLPWAGGLYDQHPVLLEQWRYIFAKRAEQQEKEEAERKAEQNKAKRPAASARGARSPRPRR